MASILTDRTERPLYWLTLQLYSMGIIDVDPAKFDTCSAVDVLPVKLMPIENHLKLMAETKKIFLSILRTATKEELNSMAKFALIVQDALKYQIDTYDAYMKLGIDELVKKYKLCSPY